MKDEPQKEVKATPQDFARKYQELCESMGYRIVVSPAWISRDDGTFSLVLQHTVGELPKNEITR